MKYSYPAILNKERQTVGVVFPNLWGCVSCGSSFKDAYKNAHEALALHLHGMIEDGEPFPKPTPPEDIQLKDGDILTYVVISLEDINSAD